MNSQKIAAPITHFRKLETSFATEMERALKKDIEDTYKDTILKRLAETHHFDLPETLVERELSAMVRQHLQHHSQRKG